MSDNHPPESFAGRVYHCQLTDGSGFFANSKSELVVHHAKDRLHFAETEGTGWLAACQASIQLEDFNNLTANLPFKPGAPVPNRSFPLELHVDKNNRRSVRLQIHDPDTITTQPDKVVWTEEVG